MGSGIVTMTSVSENQTIRISAVIPTYNEAESLVELTSEIVSVFEPMDGTYEIIFVDDGSTDDTPAIIRSLAENNPHIRYIRFRKNFGKSAALSAGFGEARGEIIATLDGDLQDDPKEVPKLMSKLDDSLDLVCGWKFPRRDPWRKRIPSLVINWMTSRLTGVPIHDMNCGLKIYKREVVENLRIYGEQHRFIPALASDKGFKIGESKVNHRPRKFGYTKFGARRILTGFFDLTTVLFLSRFVNKPLHIFGIFGVVPLMTGSAIVTYLLYLRVVYGSILDRHPLLMGGIMLVIAGLQLILTGLLAEMITLRSDRNWKHLYSVKEKI